MRRPRDDLFSRVHDDDCQTLLQHWDGTGGTGSALHHFEQTGKKYPLVVKLGTITPSSADVYSYADDENDMVLDPDLAQHLAHWGINMMQVGVQSGRRARALGI
jgi:uncharacterized UBP type Zn finger protein